MLQSYTMWNRAASPRWLSAAFVRLELRIQESSRHPEHARRRNMQGCGANMQKTAPAEYLPLNNTGPPIGCPDCYTRAYSTAAFSICVTASSMLCPFLTASLA